MAAIALRPPDQPALSPEPSTVPSALTAANTTIAAQAVTIAAHVATIATRDATIVDLLAQIDALENP